MSKRKILIIDDEMTFTELVKMNLEATGRYVVETQNKGSLALKTAREFLPELIFLDIIMPDKDGSEVFQELLADDVLSDIPVIFLSAIIPPEEAKRTAGLLEGHSYLAKPVNVKDMLAMIEEYIA